MGERDALAEQVTQILRQHYEALDERGEIEINPAMLAGAAYQQLDQQDHAPILVRYAAILELRQMARGLCRKRIEEDAENAEHQPAGLFDSQLQPRYPAMRSGQETYVRREHLTLDERGINIARLRSEGAAKLRHANALQAETDALVAQGAFLVAA
jgi:hypothetical protein